MLTKPFDLIFAGSLMIGRYPRIPVRFRLQSEMDFAIGITDEDREELQERHKAKEAGEPFKKKFVPSGTYDGISVAYINAAAIGLCWPEPGPDCPSLRQCHHDVIEYGAGVYEALFEMSAGNPKRMKSFQKDVRTLGQKLISDMNVEVGKLLVTEVAAEKVFTPGQEGTGTDG